MNLKMPLNIKWLGAALDPSGYGCANRDYIYALHNQGVNITIEPWNYEARPPAFYGETGLLVDSLKDREIDYDLIFHHYVPNNVGQFVELGKTNIGYSTWETDKLPEHWVPQINYYYALQLVPSVYNKIVYENSGITIPIKVLPHCFNYLEFKNAKKLYDDNHPIHKKFKFLSVFQWHERKFPMGLLKAYYTEFYKQKDVILIIKAYGMNYSLEEKLRLKNIIEAVKRELRFDPLDCPQILFIGELLEREQLVSLYRSCDCFVLPSRSEGFGMPFAEACAAGLTVVAPNYGGHVDFLEAPFAKLTKYQMTPVAHMSFGHYDGTMNWCDPHIIDFREGMRFYYETKKEFPERFEEYREQAQEMVRTKLSYEVIGKQLKDILEELI